VAGLTAGRAGCGRRGFASVMAMSRAQSGGDGGVSVTTVAVPLFWEKGTLIAAAVTPIVVAVVSELLRKPVERIGGVRRQTSGGTAIGEGDPPRPAEQPFEPLSVEQRVELPEVWSGDRHVYYERPRRRLDRRQLRIALVTGVLGFVLAAAFVTASELALFGKSVSQADRRTTFFGGAGSDPSDKRDEQAQPSPTPGEQTPTPTPTPTASPCEPTPTPSPTPGEQTPTATPTPTASPCQPTPTPTPSSTASPQPAPGQPTPAAGETAAPAP
jgi:hypothetical protein